MDEKEEKYENGLARSSCETRGAVLASFAYTSPLEFSSTMKIFFPAGSTAGTFGSHVRDHECDRRGSISMRRMGSMNHSIDRALNSSRGLWSSFFHSAVVVDDDDVGTGHFHVYGGAIRGDHPGRVRADGVGQTPGFAQDRRPQGEDASYSCC